MLATYPNSILSDSIYVYSPLIWTQRKLGKQNFTLVKKSKKVYSDFSIEFILSKAESSRNPHSDGSGSAKSSEVRSVPSSRFPFHPAGSLQRHGSIPVQRQGRTLEGVVCVCGMHIFCL